MGSILILRDVSKQFGDLRVLQNVRALVPEGKITAFIGPNGAGKTTLFHVIAGTLRPDSGQVRFRGEDITGQRAFSVARLGIGRLFQDVRVFGGLTVLENVLIGMVPHPRRDSWHSLFVGRQIPEVTCQETDAMRLLEEVGLQEHRHFLAKELSFGQQKLLTVARLLAQKPKVLLLDEPTAGLSHSMVEKMVTLIQRVVAEQGITVALIEHNMTVVANLAYWIHFLHEGKVAFSGESKHVLGNRSVREIYIGL